MTSPSIAVMLGTHRRLQYLPRQLTAIRAQTVQPAEIRVWHDGPETPPAADGATVIACTTNLGVWGRFYAALDFDAEYVAIFDDDTIPGPRWLENCLETIGRVGGAVGGRGAVYADGTRRRILSYGWQRPSDQPMEVDVIGHCWFMRREWLNYYAMEPRCPGITTTGEDYHLSFVLQKHLGLGVWAAPHPPGDRSRWSSLAGEIGHGPEALYRRPGEGHKKAAVHAYYRARGWKTLFDRRPSAPPKPAAMRVTTPPTLSIIIPTLGRPTLQRTLESIRGQQLVDGDEVIVVQDGPMDEPVARVWATSGLPGRHVGLDRRYADYGGTPRNAGIEYARGSYLAFLDDDDYYLPGAFRAIRNAVSRHPGRPLMFRMAAGRDEHPTIWHDMTVRPHNVGTEMFVCPNKTDQIGRWGNHRGSDYAFIWSTLKRWPPGSLVWEPARLAVYTVPALRATDYVPLRRNLLYHIYPVAGNDEWRLNVARLLRSWDLFTGRKIVGVVWDKATCDLAEVRKVFADKPDIEWMVSENVPELGEVVTFAEGCKRLESLDGFEATFYAHAKGVSPHFQTGPQRNLQAARRWRELMYCANLDGAHETLDGVLRSYACAGCIRGYGECHPMPGDLPSYWHFRGTFFWFNHQRFFGHENAFRLGQNRFAVERHMGVLFSPAEGHCFIGDDWPTSGSAYNQTADEWDRLDKILASQRVDPDAPENQFCAVAGKP